MISVLIKGCLLFLLCQLVHILIWRKRRPAAYPVWLFLIFIALPVFGLLAYSALRALFLNATLGAGEWLEWYGALLLQVACSGVYANVYPAIIVFSPSLEILKIVEQKMPDGVTCEELDLPLFSEKNMLALRFDNLERSSMIREVDGGLVLTKWGMTIARCILFYRRMLSLPCGAG